MAVMVVDTVGGGSENIANGKSVFSSHPGGATVAGGHDNFATASGSSVGGGVHNRVTGLVSTISGGFSNTAAGIFSIVGGGFHNNASGTASTIVGGNENIASGDFSIIPGGSANIAGGDYSFAAGRIAQANHDGAFVWVDSQGANFESTAPDQLLVRASGGVGINKNNPVAALDILGDIKIDDGSAAPPGRVLTAVDSAGLASWQDPAPAPAGSGSITVHWVSSRGVGPGPVAFPIGLANLSLSIAFHGEEQYRICGFL